ncbi:MAG: hypothetical protein F4X48_04100 [Acidimicrobiia bacterium]|nr:hypothetical protein [Acidimicrobiia bacterium]MYI31305.1 hypothetical protein [Acidimicrobiia bacterium]
MTKLPNLSPNPQLAVVTNSDQSPDTSHSNSQETNPQNARKTNTTATSELSQNREALHRWHVRHEQTVSNWITNHQTMLTDIKASDLQIQMDKRKEMLANNELLTPKMREAIASHPSPMMRAKLSAMHVSAEACLFAVFKSDYISARRQHLIYVQYRDEWIKQIHQFCTVPINSLPINSLHSAMQTDEFELDEIRDALEDALSQSTTPPINPPRYEAPLLLRDEHSALTSLAEQSEHVAQAADGNPKHSIAELEGGRIRRLLRSITS